MSVIVRRPIICVLTRARGRAGSPEREALLARLEAAASAGATMIQVRERQLDDRQLITFVREIAVRVRPAGALVTMNYRIDIALAAGADGVHLKSEGPPADDVRRIVPREFLIGRSVHGEDEAADVAASGACDYLMFGTVFPSRSKPPDHPVAGVETLARVCGRVAAPVVAIGGMSVDRAAAVASAGAAGIAAISLFADAADVESIVGALRDALTLPPRHV